MNGERLATLLAVSIALLGLGGAGCAAQRVVVPLPPFPAAKAASFDDLRFELRTFNITGAGSSDTNTGNAEAMRRRFLDYVRVNAKFAEIMDATLHWSDGAATPGTLIVDVAVDVDHSQWRTYVLDLFAVWPGTLWWPVLPQWGTCTVKVTARAVAPDGAVVWSKTVDGEEGYGMFWYGWYRTEPVELAYAEAGAKAFAEIMADLARSRDGIYAHLRTMPAQPVMVAKPAPPDPGPAAAPAPPPPPPPQVEQPSTQLAAQREAWVVAVMNIMDTQAADPERETDEVLLRSLSDQVRIDIARRGVRVVDRGQQERVLAEMVEEAKADSYKECYDTSCQVPLGKALAASHLLRSQIARFGKTCVLSGEMIDLAREVTVAAASVRADCSEEGFLEASESLTTNLIH